GDRGRAAGAGGAAAGGRVPRAHRQRRGAAAGGAGRRPAGGRLSAERTPVVGAFAYLTITSARNSVRQKLRRLRNPRYVLAMLFVIGYFGLILSSSLRGQEAPAGFMLRDEVLVLASLGGLVLMV